MTPDPYGIDMSLTIADAFERMRTHNINHLIVMDGETLRGTVSRSDLQLAVMIAKDDAAHRLIKDAVRPALTCSPTSYLSTILRLMESRGVDGVVVMDGDCEVAGIFTLFDAARAAQSLADGIAAAPATGPDRGDVPEVREKTLPTVRIRRMLKSAHAGPVHATGLVMGKVMA
jgi:predicted transcriptional regulator